MASSRSTQHVSDPPLPPFTPPLHLHAGGNLHPPTPVLHPHHRSSCTHPFVFHLAGHDVIGADCEFWSVPVPGRASRSLKKFYTLPKPSEKEGSARYLAELVRIAEEERIELWVSCSAQSCAAEDGQAKEVLEQRLGVVAIKFDVETTRRTCFCHTQGISVCRFRKRILSRPEQRFTGCSAREQSLLKRGRRKNISSNLWL